MGPCELRDDLPRFVVAKLGLPVLRDWARCTHPDLPLGDYVCPCAGCGSDCPGYVISPDPAADL